MGAERNTFQWAEWKTCDECGERIPHYIFHLHGEWWHPSLWQRIVGRLKRAFNYLHSSGEDAE